MNARTGKMDDFLDDLQEHLGDHETEFYNKDKRDLEMLSIETNRYNCDNFVNNNGRHVIRLCKDFDVKIVNGRFGLDKHIGHLTCHKNNGGSMVDYALLSTSLLPSVKNFYIDKLDKCLSDIHSPICLEISFKMGQKNKIDQSNVYEKLKFRSFWKPELKDDYISAFSNEDIIKSYINLVSIQPVGPHTTQDQVDNLTTELSNIYLEPAKTTGLCKKVSKGGRQPRKNPKKPWFDNFCSDKRKLLMKSKNKVLKAKNGTEKATAEMEYQITGKEYKVDGVNHCVGST